MVWVPEGAFWIDRFPVTNAHFRHFLDEVAVGTEKWFEGEHRFAAAAYAEHPATHVTWPGACAYAAWRGVRLPTAEEWQRAARGPEGWKYPWGNEFDAARCNTYSEGTTPVDFYGEAGASAYGCRDMVGNVWEWTASDSGTGHVFTWLDGQKHLGLPMKLLCGGSWAMGPEQARADACSAQFTPVRGSSNVGFRCARSSRPASR